MFYFIFFFIIFAIIGYFSNGNPYLISHWYVLLDRFSQSTKDFYLLLTEELESHGISDVEMVERKLSVSNIFSKKRIYLRVNWKEYTYDCCCAPFGKGTFVSWWLYTEKRGLEAIIAKIPFIGTRLSEMIYPLTFYRIDSSLMFMEYAQKSVLNVIDKITLDTGEKALSEEQRKPILRDVFGR